MNNHELIFMSKRLKFGVDFDYYVDYDTLRRLATEYEAAGLDSLWLMDHLIWELSGDAVLECWTVLSALAEATERIRLGTLVLCNNYRNPALLAKMAATLDIISKGRLILGIGAGWKKNEYLAYGYEFPSPHVRIGQLREAVTIIKKMWTEDEPSFQGKYYHIEKAVCKPKPLQRPHPPILIGGGGRRLLRLVAELADAYNGVFLTPASYAEKMEILRSDCGKLKRDFNSIEKTWLGPLLIGRNESELREKFRKMIGRWRSLQELRKVGIVGTPEDCLKKIQELMNAGVTHFIFTTRGLHDEIFKFLDEIRPQLV